MSDVNKTLAGVWAAIFIGLFLFGLVHFGIKAAEGNVLSGNGGVWLVVGFVLVASLGAIFLLQAIQGSPNGKK